ncbi:MAG: hypothetical protein EBS09_11555 [Flavobacteriia bacterium]|nr:hypothetical protein [Flavobacteriia bacterium]
MSKNIRQKKLELIQIILNFDKLNLNMKNMVSEIWDSYESYTEPMTHEEKESFAKTHADCLSDLERVEDNLEQVTGYLMGLNIYLCTNEMKKMPDIDFLLLSKDKVMSVRDELNDSHVLLNSEEFKKFLNLIDSI